MYVDTEAYKVYSYSTGAKLIGFPTESLVVESLAVGETGAVYATYDRTVERWDYIRDDEASAAKQRGEHVDTVFVTEA